MKNKGKIIVFVVLFIVIIVVGVLLGMPRDLDDTSFRFEEVILYIKSHANMTNNTDLDTLNSNYVGILKTNGLSSNDISLFIENNYVQKDNIYMARFVSKYGDTYVLGFNLDTNEVALRRLTSDEIADEALNIEASELF